MQLNGTRLRIYTFHNYPAKVQLFHEVGPDCPTPASVSVTCMYIVDYAGVGTTGRNRMSSSIDGCAACYVLRAMRCACALQQQGKSRHT